MVLFTSIATRIEGRKHDDLLRQKGGRGYPTLAIMDAAGEVLTRDIDRNNAGIEKAVQSALDYARLQKRREAGEDVLAEQFFLTQLRLRMLSVDEAQRGLESYGKKLVAKDVGEASSLILALEIEVWRSQMGRDKGAALNKGCYEAFKAGRSPVSGSRADEYLFYRPVLVGAGHAEDLATFEKAFRIQAVRLQKTIDAAKARGRESYAQRQLDSLNGVLARLRKLK